jgi:hypothetical protein
MYTGIIILLIILLSLMFFSKNYESFRIIISQAPRGIEALLGSIKERAYGRRTLTKDIFPDHKENFPDGTLMPTGFADQAPDKVLNNYMRGEAFAEDFTNTRACYGGAKLNISSGFSLPTRWDDTVCETHCPDYNMVGTRADTAGNLSMYSRDMLYNHVDWNVKEVGVDTNEKEYISMKSYVFTDRDSA